MIDTIDSQECELQHKRAIMTAVCHVHPCMNFQWALRERSGFHVNHFERAADLVNQLREAFSRMPDKVTLREYWKAQLSTQQK